MKNFSVCPGQWDIELGIPWDTVAFRQTEWRNAVKDSNSWETHQRLVAVFSMDNMFGKFTIEPYRAPLPAMRKECQMWCFEFLTSSNLNLCKKCQLWCVHFLHLWISWPWAHINWKMFTVYEKMYKMDQTSQKVIIHGSPPINEIVITRCFPTCFFQLRRKTAESSKPHHQAVSIYINMQIMRIFRYLDFYSRYSRCIDHIYICTLCTSLYYVGLYDSMIRTLHTTIQEISS